MQYLTNELSISMNCTHFCRLDLTANRMISILEARCRKTFHSCWYFFLKWRSMYYVLVSAYITPKSTQTQAYLCAQLMCATYVSYQLFEIYILKSPRLMVNSNPNFTKIFHILIYIQIRDEISKGVETNYNQYNGSNGRYEAITQIKFAQTAPFSLNFIKIYLRRRHIIWNVLLNLRHSNFDIKE